MNRPLAILSSLLTSVLGASATATAQETREPAPPPVRAESDVADLIRRLGDDRYDERRSAEKALLELGDKASRALAEAAEGHDDAAVRWRANRLLERIERGDRRSEQGLRSRLEAAQPQARGEAWQDRIDTMLERLEQGFDNPFGGRGLDIGRQLDEMRAQIEALRAQPWAGGQFGPGTGQSMSMSVGPDGVRLEVEERGSDGAADKKVYEAPDLDAFRAKYPDVARRYLDGGFAFRHFGGMAPAPWFGGAPSDEARPMRRLRARAPGVEAEVEPEVSTEPPSDRRLGVLVGELSPEVRTFLGIDADRGLLVESVQDDSLASDLGIRPRDVVLEIAGRTIASPAHVADALGSLATGQDVTVSVNRMGSVETLRAKKR